jgi:hypothetical protein
VSLVGLGGVAVPLPIGEPLHHLDAAVACSRCSSLSARSLAVCVCGEAAGKGNEGQR